MKKLSKLVYLHKLATTLSANAVAKWNCPNCLASNDTDKLKCACCQTDKPASSVATSLTSSASEPLSLFSKKYSLPTQPTLILPENIKTSTSAANLSGIKFGMSSSSSSSSNSLPIRFDSTSTLFKIPLAKPDLITAASNYPATAVTTSSPEVTTTSTPVKPAMETPGPQFSFKPLESTAFGTAPSQPKSSSVGFFGVTEKSSITTNAAKPSVVTLATPTFGFGTAATSKPGEASFSLFKDTKVETAAPDSTSQFKFASSGNTFGQSG